MLQLQADFQVVIAGNLDILRIYASTYMPIRKTAPDIGQGLHP